MSLIRYQSCMDGEFLIGPLSLFFLRGEYHQPSLMMQVHIRFKCNVDPPNNITVDVQCPLNPHINVNVKSGGRTRSENITNVALVGGGGVKNENCGAGG